MPSCKGFLASAFAILISSLVCAADPVSLNCATILANYQLVPMASIEPNRHFHRKGVSGSGILVDSGPDRPRFTQVWNAKNMLVTFSSNRESLDFFGLKDGKKIKTVPLKLFRVKSHFIDGAGPLESSFMDSSGENFYSFGPNMVLYRASLSEIFNGKTLKPVVDFRKHYLKPKSGVWLKFEKVKLSIDGKRLFIHLINNEIGHEENFVPMLIFGVFDMEKHEWKTFTRIVGIDAGHQQPEVLMSRDGSTMLTRVTVADPERVRRFAEQNAVPYVPHGISVDGNLFKRVMNVDTAAVTPLVYPEGSNKHFNTNPTTEISNDGSLLWSWYNRAYVGFDTQGVIRYSFDADGSSYYPIGRSPDDTVMFFKSTRNAGHVPTIVARDLTREGAPEIEAFAVAHEGYQAFMTADGKYYVTIDRKGVIQVSQFREKLNP